MKIVVNYDLINRIKEAQADPNFTLIKEQTKYYAIWYCIYFALDSVVLRKTFQKSFTESFMSILRLFVLFNFIPFFKAYSGIKRNSERITANQLKAVQELLSLISRLSEKDINTSLELLYKAEEYKTKYRSFEEEGKIYLMQEKYIMLPTETFTGDRKDVSLLQEHIIGREEYILSLGSPKKTLQLRPVFNI